MWGDIDPAPAKGVLWLGAVSFFAGEVEEAKVVRATSFPTNEQTSELVVPGVGALHHPPAGLALHAAEQRSRRGAGCTA
jgi:hypothetical protein